MRFYRCRYDENRHKDQSCSYNQNKAYVVFSAMGSFFVPLVVVVYVYFKISCVIAERHNKLEALNGPKSKVKSIEIGTFNKVRWRTSELLGTHRRPNRKIAKKKFVETRSIFCRHNNSRSTRPLSRNV